jgi:hypothetical protein
VRNDWKTVLKDKEKHNQARKSERSDGLRGILDTHNPRITGQRFVNELVSVFYLSKSDVKLYRPTSVVEMAAITIDMIRINHSSIKSVLKTLLHLGYFIEHSTYQRTLMVL